MENRNFHQKTNEWQDCDFVDILFHPADWSNWKSATMSVVGGLFGLPVYWVHCSLRVSLAEVEREGESGRHEVIYDYTDHGVLAHDELKRPTTGVVRIFFEPDEHGFDKLDTIIGQIERLRQVLDPFEWRQAWYILLRQEPTKFVCTTFVTDVLGLGDCYRTPVCLYQQLKDNRENIESAKGVRGVAFYASTTA